MADRVPSYVYFIKPIGMASPIKIGCSIKPPRRLVSLMAWSPFPLEIITTAPGSYAEEGRLITMFREHRSHSEWFYGAPELLAFIEDVRRAGRLPFDATINHISLGHRLDGLLAILKKNGVSRKEFAAQAGVHPQTIWMWCRYNGHHRGVGRAVIALKELGIECSLDELYGRSARSDAEAA